MTVTLRGRHLARSTWSDVPPPRPTNSADGRAGTGAASIACHQYSRVTRSHLPPSGYTDSVSPATIRRRSAVSSMTRTRPDSGERRSKTVCEVFTLGQRSGELQL